MEVLNVIAVINDVHKICRTCLAERADTELHNLYTNTLDNMIWGLVGFVKPMLGDGLPSNMCFDCVSQLNAALTFKEQCQKSEERLRHLLLVAPPQRSGITLKELLSSNDEISSLQLEPETDIPAVQVQDIAIQTDIIVFENRIKRKGTRNCSSPNRSEDDLFIDTPQQVVVSVVNKTEEEKKEPKYKCKKCPKVYRSSTGLRIHSIKHRKKLKCEVCGKQFGLIKQLNKHTKLHKDYKPYVCKVCKKGFGAAGNLSKHMRVHGGEKKHLCITCGRRFFEPGHLAVHMRTHTGEKPIVCNVCGKRFGDPHGLVAHNKIHTGERNFECKTCGKRFAHSFVLTAHMRIHTGEKPYNCAICGASFATGSYLTIHKRTHTQEKPFSCEVCPKAFVSKCALVAHNMTHTGEKRFQCNVCGKRVARAADLNIHMRSHTGERPYSCDQCPKSYHTSSNLSAHKRTHLGIKNHVCPICGKAFADSRTLRGHTRIHTGEKPYACQICGNQYSQSGQLAAHRKIHNQPPIVNNRQELKVDSIMVQQLPNPMQQEQNISTVGQLIQIFNPEQIAQQTILSPVTEMIPVIQSTTLYSDVTSQSQLLMSNNLVQTQLVCLQPTVNEDNLIQPGVFTELQ